jgi:hypothetical protein
LRGDGYVVLFRTTRELRRAERFTPDSLRGREAGRQGVMMFVDYAESPVGPYQELLWIPCKFRFGGRPRWSITRIFVSSWESVVNGQANWGIPKDRARFDIAVNGSERRVTVEQDGRQFAELRFRERGPSVPLVAPGRIIESIAGLAQHRAGATYFYTPSAMGWVRPGSLLEARFDGERFPDLALSRVEAVVRVTKFRLTFPVPRIEPGVG